MPIAAPVIPAFERSKLFESKTNKPSIKILTSLFPLFSNSSNPDTLRESRTPGLSILHWYMVESSNFKFNICV